MKLDLSNLFKAATICIGTSACSTLDSYDGNNLISDASTALGVVGAVSNPVATLATAGLNQVESTNDLHPELQRLASIMPKHSDFDKGADIIGFVPFVGGALANEADGVASMIDLAKAMTERYPSIDGFRYTGIEYNGQSYSIAAVYSPTENDNNRVLATTDFPMSSSRIPDSDKTCVREHLNLMRDELAMASQAIDWPMQLAEIENIVRDYDAANKQWHEQEDARLDRQYKEYTEESDRISDINDARVEKYYAAIDTNPDLEFPEMIGLGVSIPRRAEIPENYGLPPKARDTSTLNCG